MLGLRILRILARMVKTQFGFLATCYAIGEVMGTRGHDSGGTAIADRIGRIPGIVARFIVEFPIPTLILNVALLAWLVRWDEVRREDERLETSRKAREALQKNKGMEKK